MWFCVPALPSLTNSSATPAPLKTALIAQKQSQGSTGTRLNAREGAGWFIGLPRFRYALRPIRGG
jgi:hypothetical protein